MATKNSDLVGKYFLEFGGRGEDRQGWVLQQLDGGLFLIQVYTEPTEKTETVLQVVHPAEMRGWCFYRNSDLAQQHYDRMLIDDLEEIDLEPIRKSAGDELVDTILEELGKAQANRQDKRAEELINLLQQLTD